MDKLQKAEELKREARDLERQVYEEKERIQRKKNDEFKEKFKIDTWNASDYAGLDSGDLHFYYGYEYTKCPEHGSDDCSRKIDCEKSEWAFIVTNRGKELMRLAQSELRPEEGQEMYFYLLMGIGHYFKNNLLT